MSLIPSGHDDRCDNIPGGNGSVPDSDFVLTTSSRLNCDRLSSKIACFDDKKSTQELESLPNIGPSRAEQIIAHRPYTSVDELSQVKASRQG